MAALLVACAGRPAKARPADDATLVSALQAAGARVGTEGTVQQPFFSPIGQVAKVNGMDLQVFEFAAAASAKAAAQTVAKDGGSVGTSMVSWVEPPHFYLAGKVIVLYLGSDTGMMAMLKITVGPQFAGR